MKILIQIFLESLMITGNKNTKVSTILIKAVVTEVSKIT
jgi:hypothetical protein